MNLNLKFFLPCSSINSSCGLAANLPPLFLVGVAGPGDFPSSACSTDSLRLKRVTGAGIINSYI